LNESIYFNKIADVRLAIILSILSIFLMVIGMGKQGLDLDSFFLTPLEVGGQYAQMRYEDGLEVNLIQRFGLSMAYMATVCCGYCYGFRSNGRVIMILFALFPAIIMMILQSSKGLLFFSVMIFIASAYVGSLYTENKIAFSKNFKTLIFFPLLILILTSYSFLSRGSAGESILDSMELIINSLKSYSGGHLFAFSDWFSHRYLDESSFIYSQPFMQNGFYTFMSIYRLLGDDRYVPLGIYDEFYVNSQITTNIYTVFRGLISDFTLLGSLLAMVVMGTLVSGIYKNLLIKRRPLILIILYPFIIGLIYQTYSVSTLTWNQIYVVILMLLIFYSIKIRSIKY
jgi:oligosaccharide repeat unit polymerase